jgi:anaerobic selenocysteine-containing dehydrogenase
LRKIAVAARQNNIIRTMCPMNCYPTLCGMLVEERDGEIVKLSGDKENPDSQGFLCVRGQASREIIGNPERILHPMIRERRDDDAWRQASWDEAFDLITRRMRQVGRESVGIWAGHGIYANNFGVNFSASLIRRFANLYGCQYSNGVMICWGLGGFGLGITGVLESNTKEDLGQHAALVVLWGANLASQPNTARYLLGAKRRGARIVAIDVRQCEATAQADEVILIRPGSDAALALALMHVIIAENLHNSQFVADHTQGFSELTQHVRPFTPDWAAGVTGIDADRIVALARLYATTAPAMIMMGGSSMHKGKNNWHASRAISCLPALTGYLGVPGGGLGPRHASVCHGHGLGDISATDRRLPGRYIPNQMADIAAALSEGRIRTLFLLGSNMLSSFADSEHIAAGLNRAELVVSYDLFMNETTRRFADVVLPGTAWLEELGCKMTNTHIYLMERALQPAGQARALHEVLKGLADRLGVADFYPWSSQEGVIDAILDHPCTGGATVASLRANGGIGTLDVSHVAYPTHKFHTPSGKVEFYSTRAEKLGLPPLPVQTFTSPSAYPLTLCQGRTLAQFHSFYDQGQALPTLRERNRGPELWISPGDAEMRGLLNGDAIRIHNERGSFQARAQVTEKTPIGVVWMRDGWSGLNNLTSGVPVLPTDALTLFPFTVGQASFDAMVEVSPIGSEEPSRRDSPAAPALA